MQYIRPYTFLFSIRNAATSLLLLSVCLLIPIVGMIVVLGYRAEMADDLDADADDTRVEDFNFDRFSEMLGRGVWPFLYVLMQTFVWGFAYFVTYLGMIFAFISAGPRPDPALVIGTLAIWAVSIGLFYILTSMLIWPFLLYSSLTRRFAFGESCRFARDFFGRVGWSMLRLVVPKMLFDAIAYTIGTLLCFVGLYPAWVIVMAAEQHFIMQLYRKYLERGGRRIATPDVVHLRESPDSF